MKKPIIEIPQASENLIKELIKRGLLYIGKDGKLHATDKENENGNNRKN